MTDDLVVLIPAAFALDLALGDPRWMPHPVRGVGLIIRAFDRVLPRSFEGGVLLAAAVCALAAGGAWGILWAAGSVGRFWGLACHLVLLYFAFAARDLGAEALKVYRDLDDLPGARESLARIVGRDTGRLDEREVVRAAVESVAEGTVDGVVTPMLFAALGGAPAAWLFKAASTLDSMVGYRTLLYEKMGWASAKLDTAANWLPARITGWLIAAAAYLAGFRAAGAVRMMLRDGRKTESLNAGIPEAAMAGALGVRLGGTNFYGGEPSFGAALGDAERALEREDIRRAVRMMYVAAFLALGLAVALRLGIAWFASSS